MTSFSNIVKFRWVGRRTAIGVLLAMGMATGAGIAPQVMANESHNRGRPAAIHWVNTTSSACLTASHEVPVEGPTMKHTVTAEPCNAKLTIDQKWMMAGTHLKNNSPTGTVCLEARNGYAHYGECNETDPAQKFEFTELAGPSGARRIFHIQSGKCLDISGSDIYQAGLVHVLDCNGGETQAWELVK